MIKFDVTNFDAYIIIKDLVNYVEHTATCVEQFYDYGDYNEVKKEFFKTLKNALDIPFESL